MSMCHLGLPGPSRRWLLSAVSALTLSAVPTAFLLDLGTGIAGPSGLPQRTLRGCRLPGRGWQLDPCAHGCSEETPFQRFGVAFLSALLAFSFFASSAGAVVSRSPNDMSEASHVYSVGDLHGDDQSYRMILKSLGLMSEDGHWRGGNSILVQTGDVTDRGDASGPIFRNLLRLQDEAAESGGKVILLLGNHELMNLQSDFRYASAKDTTSLIADEGSSGSRKNRAAVFSKEGWLGHALRSRFQSVALEHKVLFVHAGLLPNFSQAYGSAKGPELVEKVNEEIQNLLKQDADGLREESSPLLSDEGPFWTRRLALGPERRICQELQESLDAFDANRMVVGHTAQADGRVHSRCGDRLILGDTLISRFYTGTAHPSAIEYFMDGTLEAIDVVSSQRYRLGDSQ